MANRAHTCGKLIFIIQVIDRVEEPAFGLHLNSLSKSLQNHNLNWWEQKLIKGNETKPSRWFLKEKY